MSIISSACVITLMLGIGVPVTRVHAELYPVVPSENQRENCRLLAITCRRDGSDSILHDTLTEFSYPRYPQRNGWSLSMFSNFNSGGLISRPLEPMIIRSEKNVEYDRDTYNSAVDLAVRLKPDLLIGHLRNASSGCNYVADPHPFVRTIESGQYLFCHNGGIWGNDLDMVINEMVGGFAEPQSCPGTPIDSEYLFLSLLKMIEKSPNETFLDIVFWFGNIMDRIDREWNALNFVLTDGQRIWALRCSLQDDRFPLHICELGDNLGYAVSTQALGPNWAPMANFQFVELRLGARPRFFDLVPGRDTMGGMVDNIHDDSQY